MNTSWQLLLLYLPSIVFGLLLLHDVHHEPRQFRNAIWLLLFVVSLAGTLLLQFGREYLLLPVALLVVATPILVVAFLLINNVIVVGHEGLRLSTILPSLLALCILAMMTLFPLLSAYHAPLWLTSLAGLITLEGVWFFFTFAALLLYSYLYRLLPRKRLYDYIVVHGAGLLGDQPTPLLKGRLDKALQLWEQQGSKATIIVSGGQGSDEVISEAQAMEHYLVCERGVNPASIVQEAQSTTTLENLQYSKEIIEQRCQGRDYRAALVTSDYHVYRASEYASKVGLKADGIGSHTKGYYWPTAFIREFIAVSRAHLWPYIVIGVFWLIPTAIGLLNNQL
ncbi:membrane protein [Bombiscardovia apis]|uniref:Membrane protein n=1 Tax=Bombiscardovia apis TaxID=2932182 RepID=A0ABN6SDQ4_9BIFI|nr:YdcF family protein [Bombiscardovia apis]BDR54180.1 membrane protein [Bombiscardovia apis]